MFDLGTIRKGFSLRIGLGMGFYALFCSLRSPPEVFFAIPMISGTELQMMTNGPAWISTAEVQHEVSMFFEAVNQQRWFPQS